VTRRRRTFLAIAATAVVLVTAGLGARRDDRADASDDPCSDLADLSEFCASEFECGGVAEDFADACQAACMTGLCSDRAGYAKQDPILSASCTDMAGAPYWDNLRGAEARCRQKLHFGYVKVDWAVYDECAQADAEQRCPELAGTDWWARFKVARGR
jgi:hypothetical protein